MARSHPIWLVLLLPLAGALAQQEKPPSIPDLLQAGQTAYLHGDYEAARQAFMQAYEIARPGPLEDPIRYDILKRLVSVRSAAGEWADADNYLQLAISWREQNVGLNDPKVADDLLISVGFARAQKDYGHALMIMQRVMGLHLAANSFDSVVFADDNSRLAQIESELNHPEKAIAYLETALKVRTRLAGPLDPSLIYDLDRMAGLQIIQRAYDQAEATYRHALVIRETLYGKMHADLLASVDGLAYSLFGQKKYDDAEPQYQRLLELWKFSVGTEIHPMIAVVLDKIAVFYADQKKWEQARAAAARANAIRASLLADGLSGEATQRIDEGKMNEAVPLYERAIRVLDPPDTLYDKQRVMLDAQKKEIEKALKRPLVKAPPRKK